MYFIPISLYYSSFGKRRDYIIIVNLKTSMIAKMEQAFL